MIKRRLLSRHFLGGLLLLFFQLAAFSQNKTITGVVTAENGSPLEGATVAAKGKAVAVTTNSTGAFQISIDPTVNTLIISFVGFENREVSVKNQSVVTVSLQSTKAILDSVVVVGYGTQRRKDVTGAISSVRGDAIKNLPVSNVADALQGRVAGVEVIKATGEPGAPSQIIIRGVASLNQPQPLYIVDGVRQSGDNINVQDIASVDIMKDASAAAIYGSAAAGGVIIVTTKKGQGPKPTVNLSTRYGITKPRVIKLLDRDNFVRAKRLVLDANYMANNQTDTLPDTDWSDEIYRNGIEENYNASVSGSTPSINYFVSGVHNNQKGVFLDNVSKFNGVRVNTDVKVSDRIKIGEQVYFWQRNTDPVGIPAITPLFRSVPTMSVYSRNPQYTWGQNPAGFTGPNYVAQIKTADRNFRQLNFQGNAYAEVKLPFSLTFRTTVGYTYYTEESNYFQDVYSSGAVQTPINKLEKRMMSVKTLLSASTLAFDRSFDRHNINALIGYEQYSTTYNAITTSATSVGGQSYAYVTTSNSVLNIENGGYDPYGLVKSLFGRVNYDYNKKYFASVSARRDGDFIRFGPGNQYGVFPAASIGWRISEESFFQKALPVVNQLKLRASHGLLGNNNIGTYRFLSTYRIINSQNFAPGASPERNYTINNLTDRNIKWESVYETNIGLDAEFLNGKLSFSADWYNKTTKDLLYALPIPSSTGITEAFLTNIGTVRNRGLDLLIGYKDRVRDFSYNVIVTGSFNKNKVVNLDNINSNPIKAGNNNYGPTEGIWLGQDLTYTKAGLPFGQFYGFIAEGIYQSERQIDEHAQQENKRANVGDLIFKDVNGDNKITDDDRTIIGNPYPKLTYGASINLSWKGFDIAMLFNGVAGVDIFNGVAPYAQSLWSDGNTTSKFFNASYLGNNGLTSQPRVGVLSPDGTSFTADPNRNYSLASSYFVEDGSYVKMKNLQIGYSFSNSLLNKVKIRSVRVFLMGNNLFTITKYSGIDPELGGDVTTRAIDITGRYPSVRTYSAGIDLTF